MDVNTARLITPGEPPTRRKAAAWIGPEGYAFWKKVENLIERNYPRVFTPEWLFGGKKHGWSLRYKKSRPLCTFIPEKGAFKLLIVFGAKEREKIESIRGTISVRTMNEYDQATTYHDGKWVRLEIDSDVVVEDVAHLLAVKRRPSAAKKKKNEITR